MPAPRAAIGQRIERGVAETALGHGGGATERLVVGRVRDQLQVRHEIADLAAVEEAHRAHEPVRDRLAAEGILERAALRVRAVEHRDVAQVQPAVTLAPRGDLLGDVLGFIALIERAGHRHRLARRMRRAERLAAAADVRGDRRIGHRQHLGRGPVVLLEPHHARRREILLEVQDVPHVGAAPTVDRLVIVAHDLHVPVLAAQEFHQLVLRPVRVLVFIHEQIAELRAVRGEPLRVLLQDAYGQHEQVIEIGGVRFAQRAVEQFVHARRGSAQRIERERCVLHRSHQRVLRVGDRAPDRRRPPLLGGDLQALHRALHRGERVILIVDREAHRALRVRCFPPQQSRADRMEGARPHPRGFRAKQPRDAFLHLARRLVREGDRQDMPRIHAVVLHQTRDARGEHARLARPRARKHEHGAVAVDHCFVLCRIQAREHLRFAAGQDAGHPGSITSNVAPFSEGASSSRPP